MKGDAIALAQLSSGIQTAGAAVAVLKTCTEQIAIARQAVQLIPEGYLRKDPVAAGFSFLLGSTQSVQDSLRSSLDQAQTDVDRYAAFYRGYEGDDLAQEISTAHSMGIASTLQFCNKVLNECVDEIGDGPTINALDLVGGVATALAGAAQFAGEAAQKVVQGAANTAAGLVSAFWVPIAVVGGALALIVLWRNGALKGAAA